MRILFIFIDGFGLGDKNKEINPLYHADVPNIIRMLEEYIVVPTDAALGVPGLPQSATGQTTILTGKNAAKALGRHLNGQPTRTLRKLLDEYSIFKVLKEMGLKVTNANVYRHEYLRRMMEPQNPKFRPSASTVACMAAQLPFRTIEDLKAGKGLYHDIVHKILIESGYDIELIKPTLAAERLAALSEAHDFTFFEYFMTDLIGHRQNMKKAEKVLEILDKFLGALDRIINYDETLLIIASDHGNIEDLSVKTHTYHKVPTIAQGKNAQAFASSIHALTDIAPGIINLFKPTDTER